MRIGLIGRGKRAIEHIHGLRHCPGVEIVAADPDPARARPFGEAQSIAWVESPAAIFADRTIAAVDLCVPAKDRTRLIRRSLAASKDFLCQQPLCETAAEARELDDLARRHGCIGMVERIHRHAPAFQKARAILVKTGKTGVSPVLGKLTAATMRIGNSGRGTARHPSRSAADGELGQLLAHLLDLVVWCFGPVERAQSMVSEALSVNPVTDLRSQSFDDGDFALARCWTRAGFPILIQADMLSPRFAQTIEVQGENGAVMASTEPDMPQFVFAANAADGYAAGRTDLSCGAVDLLAAQMSAFVAAVRDRAPKQWAELADCVPVIDALGMLRG